jgi:hypothetical protein
MIPVDLRDLLHKRLLESRRPPDGLLHASGDLLGSLRHAQLRLAGAPTIESEIVSDIRLMTGTMWHAWVGESLVRAGVSVMQEVRLTPWFPEGWGGTADWVFWHPKYRGFVLGDLKTIKGEGMRWVLKDGAKEEHLWQLSAYWHALYDMGLPMVTGFGVLYWPMDDTTERDELIEPVVMECEPLPRELVHGAMADRWQATQTYLAELDRYISGRPAPETLDGYLRDSLAPEIERVQKVFWNGKQGVFDVKLVPHWSAQFCPYPTELCGCSEQGTTKIGEYSLDGKYKPRKGYETELPMVAPSEMAYARQRRKAAESEPEDTLEEDLKATLEAAK